MKRLSILTVVCSTALMLFSRNGLAEPTTLTFSQPDFEWYQISAHYDPPNHIWEVGDYWAQNFPGTALSSASTMSLTLVVDDNDYDPGTTVTIAVLLNGVAVGNLSISWETRGVQNYNFSFPVISGPDYRVQLQIVDRVYVGGCAAITIDGPSFAVIE